METFSSFVGHYPVRNFKKGEIIVCQGMVPRGCYVVRSGFVKVFLTTKDGEEKSLGFDSIHDLLPLTWIFGRTKSAIYYYQAFTDCEAYEIPRGDLVHYLYTQPELFHKLFEKVLDLNIDLLQHIQSLEQAKASDKLLYAFSFLVRRFGKRVTQSRVRMLLPLTQQDLANFLGLTRETTGTQLKALQHKGIISYRHQQYIVHTDR